VNRPPSSLTWHRVVLWTALVLFALWFLTPLYVMIVTSLKDMDQIRGGNLMDLPSNPSFASWGKAWNQACTGTDAGRAADWSFVPSRSRRDAIHPATMFGLQLLKRIPIAQRNLTYLHKRWLLKRS